MLKELTIILAFLKALSELQSQYLPEAEIRTKMPTSTAEVGELILRCYHPTGRFEHAQIMEVPWSRQLDYSVTQSAKILITWHGNVTRRKYHSTVALLRRGNMVRAAVLDENSIIQYSRHCYLQDWVESK